MKLFEVFGEIKLDDKPAMKGLNNVDSKAKNVSKKMGGFVKSVGKLGAITAGIAVAAGGALLGVADKVTGSLDRIDKMSQRLGLTKEAFQEWDYILSQSGVSIDSMQSGMKRLSKNAKDAAEGVGVGAEAFDALGVSVTNSNGEMKSQEDLFEESIIKLQSMESGIEKAALAQDLFGRSGQELLPLLNAEASSVEELKNKAHELGLVQSDEMVSAGAAFQDNLDSTTRMLKSMGTGIMINVLPMLNKFLSWVQVNMPIIKEWFSMVIDNYINPIFIALKNILSNLIIPIFTAFKVWLDENMPIIKEWFLMVIENYVIPIWKELYDVFMNFILPAFTKVYEWIVEFMPIIKEAFKIAFDVINPIVKLLWTIITEFILPVLAELFSWLSESMPLITGFFKTAFDIINPIVQKLHTIITEYIIPILQELFDWTNENMPLVKGFFKTAFDVILAIITTVFDKIVELFDALRSLNTWISTNLSKIGDVFNTVFNGIYNVVDETLGIIGDVLDGLSKAIEKAKEFFSIDGGSNTGGGSMFGGGMSNFGESLSTSGSPPSSTGLGVRAEGGPVNSGDPYIVGEKEPELFVPDRDGQIYNQKQMSGISGITQNITINSPKSLSAREIARNINKNSRRMALEWR